MPFITKCSLLLLAASFTSMATGLQESTCSEAEPCHGDHDQFGFIQNELLVQRHIDEQVVDREQKVANSAASMPPLVQALPGTSMKGKEEPAGVEPSLSEKTEEVEHNVSDKKVITVKLDSQLQVAADWGPDWLKSMAHELDFIPDIDQLEKMLQDAIKGVGMFVAKASGCTAALQEVHKEDHSELIKVVKGAFACFDAAVIKLAEVVKSASASLVQFSKRFLPTQVLSALAHEQEVTIDATYDFSATAINATGELNSASASVICDKVKLCFVSLERTAVDFIQAIANLNPLSAHGKFEDLKTQIDDFIKKLPGDFKERAEKLVSILTKTTDEFLEKIPKAMTNFKESILTALTGRICLASDLRLRARAAALSPHLLGLATVLSLSVLVRGVFV